ncbi:MAG: alpha/beta hydrolase [Chitinophagaceae bacterium]|nr:alpha/beta hydrolase [Chitinophagaceae bacterium]
MKSIVTALLLLVAHLPAVAQGGKNAQPFVLGRIEKLYSRQLSEDRTLNIYLPPGYKEGDTTHYPVIYLLDGGADEDFIHIAGLVQFYTFPWVGRLPECIVVGIANEDRKRDFTFPANSAEYRKILPSGGGSAAFIAFLEQELQPFIRQRYRGRKQGMLIGQSLGGLLATEILLKHSSMFDRYVIISPSLWWNNGSLLQEKMVKKAGKQAVYIAVGKEGLTPGAAPHVMEVDANLLADQLKNSGQKNLEVHFDYLPAEDHGTIMHQAVSNAFKTLYPISDQ